MIIFKKLIKRKNNKIHHNHQIKINNKITINIKIKIKIKKIIKNKLKKMNLKKLFINWMKMDF